jgi:hypothetical protein
MRLHNVFLDTFAKMAKELRRALMMPSNHIARPQIREMRTHKGRWID